MTDTMIATSRTDIGTHSRELILDAQNIAVDFKVEGGVVHAVRDAVTGQVRELPPVELKSVEAGEAGHWDSVITGMKEVVKPGGTAVVASAGAYWFIMRTVFA